MVLIEGSINGRELPVRADALNPYVGPRKQLCELFFLCRTGRIFEKKLVKVAPGGNSGANELGNSAVYNNG